MMMKRCDTYHSQQVSSGRQPAVVRDLDPVPGQMRQLRVLDHHLEEPAVSSLGFKWTGTIRTSIQTNKI